MILRKHKFLRAGLGSLMLVFLLSCGGGSEVGGGSVSGSLTGNGVTLGGSSGGDGTGGGGSSSGSGSASAGGGSDGGSTSTAGNGTDDGSGVGSGGTGVSSANAGTSVGSVDGMGSIIVDGVRYDIDKTDPTMIDLRDATGWQLGMTVAVTGPVDADFATGTALKLKSMAQLRGAVDAVDTTASTPNFQLLGSTVSVDDETVWADLAGLAGLSAGTQVQVWALPVAPGLLRATRVETQAIAGTTTLVTGMISGLDSAGSTFMLGNLTIDYHLASLPADALANGRIVRVEAVQPPAGGRLQATSVEAWYALSTVKDAPVQLEGVITDFASKASFKLMGVTIEGPAAAVTGGQENKLANGVRVVAAGTISQTTGALVATKIKIRHIPGGGALTTYYDLHGTIDNYVSPSNMRVRGTSGVQRVDISAATISGTGTLANGQKVRVQGSKVVSGVLQVTALTYE
ncbi:MAG: hypothetical protein JSS56_15000 [Proteobacteria bacterium]|nr:hypothetical protein [Pseudomonadota bacterium]